MRFSEALGGRRFVLLSVTGLLALVLGFFTLTDDQSLRAIIYGGYWVMLLLTTLFIWTLVKIWRDDWKGWEGVPFAPRWPAVLIIVCGILLLVHEAYGFKILMDEVMLLGTSMSMHFEKLCLVAMRGHDITGAFELLGGDLDKRPLFQPFLVSVLHDLTGYRPENCFVLNTGLTFLLLTLAYRLGFRIAGRGAGAAMVLLLTSLPLLAQNATGGGFEVLNLVMILSTVLLAMRYAQRQDENSEDALILSSVLLAETRYESVLFLLPVALSIGYVWWKRGATQITWITMAAPLMLVPYALHNRVFQAHATAWELGSQPGYEHPFSVSYFSDNVAHAVHFFFSTTGEHSNSLILAGLGFIALPFFVLWLIKTWPKIFAIPTERAILSLFALGFIAHTLLLMFYFWGKFDDPVIRRLSLPLNLLLAIAVVTVVAEFRARVWIWRSLAGVVGIGMFAFSIPSMARHDYSLDYYVGREMEWRRKFISEHPEKDYLFIDNNSIIWITHLISGTPVKHALTEKGIIQFNLRNRIFSSIYVFQRYTVEPEKGKLILPAEDDLGPDYHLETVWERRFTPLTVSRISRVVSIDDGPVKLPVPAPAAAAAKHTPEELEKIRQEYLDNFIKRLP